MCDYDLEAPSVDVDINASLIVGKIGERAMGTPRNIKSKVTAAGSLQKETNATVWTVKRAAGREHPTINAGSGTKESPFDCEWNHSIE